MVGVSIPAGLHAMPKEECETMQSHQMEKMMLMEQHTHMPGMDMEKHESGIACQCHIEEAPVKTKASLLKKVQPPVLVFAEVVTQIAEDEPEQNHTPVPFTITYTQPPLFLLNAAFLN